jgi:hypothetical protein
MTASVCFTLTSKFRKKNVNLAQEACHSVGADRILLCMAFMTEAAKVKHRSRHFCRQGIQGGQALCGCAAATGGGL